MNGLKKVFPRTVPIVISYFFMAIGFGVLIKSVGQSNVVGGLMSGGIYAGAMQFAMVSLFSNPLNVLELAILAISINLRYLFYTLSLLGPLSELPMWKRIAVACAGTRPATGAMTMANRNIIAVTTEVRPVRPPAPMPAALST